MQLTHQNETQILGRVCFDHEDLHMYVGVSWRHDQICSLVNLFWWPGTTVITRMSRSDKWRGSRRFADGIVQNRLGVIFI